MASSAYLLVFVNPVRHEVRAVSSVRRRNLAAIVIVRSASRAETTERKGFYWTACASSSAAFVRCPPSSKPGPRRVEAIEITGDGVAEMSVKHLNPPIVNPEVNGIVDCRAINVERGGTGIADSAVVIDGCRSTPTDAHRSWIDLAVQGMGL